MSQQVDNKPKLSQEAIDRLRLSRVEDAKSAESEGFHAGFEWASTKASAAELKRLSEESQQDETWGMYFDERCVDNFNHFGQMGCLADGILGMKDAGWGDIESFWESALGDHAKTLLEDLDFMRGFCEGALEAWSQFQAVA